jgi:hypothetical protein
MKLNFAIVALVLFSLSTTVTSCKKPCGYCQTTCPGAGGTGGTGNIVTNSATVCKDDGGVQQAISNAQQACSQANATLVTNNTGCTANWVNN